MKSMKKGVSKKVFSIVLAATMVMGMGGVPALADDEGGNNQPYTYSAPDKPMEVDDTIITATAHRAASPIV